MRVLVYGAGAIGLYAAGKLAQAGCEVTLKGRSATVEAFTAGPLRISTAAGVEEVPGIVAVEALPAEERFDLIVVATKAWQVSQLAGELPGLLAEDGRVLTLQNGVDAPAHVAVPLGEGSVLAGAIVVIAKRVGPAAVEVVGREAALTVGTLGKASGATPAKADERALAKLREAGLAVEWTGNVRSALWKKLALIASYGGVGALANATVGETRTTPETRVLVEQAMREVIAVGNAAGADLDGSDLADLMRTYESGFAPETTASMQRDLAAGVPSELADQNGAVVAHAARAGISVPIHATIYASQLPRERAARR